MSVALVFPGQGSQIPGMGRDLYESRAEARAIFKEASDATGIDVQKLCFDGSVEELRETQNAQLALFTVSSAAWQCLKPHLDGIIRIDGLAGHSVGEYAAIAAAGIVSISNGAKLVRRRGELMAEQGIKTLGTMSAVLGLSKDQLEEVIKKVEGVVVIANENCPGQIVISGDLNAVKQAGELAIEAGAKRVLPLNVSGAFHSPLMQAAADQLGEMLDLTEFRVSTRIGAVYANVTSEAVGRPPEFRNLLKEQIIAPVRWTETIEHLMRDGIDTFIECGVGEVLSGLIKRISREATCLKCQDLDSLEATIAAIRR